jgi:hypothetical protein
MISPTTKSAGILISLTHKVSVSKLDIENKCTKISKYSLITVIDSKKNNQSCHKQSQTPKQCTGRVASLVYTMTVLSITGVESWRTCHVRSLGRVKGE